MEDEIVNEIHEIRRRIFEECDGDIECLIERLKTADAPKKIDWLRSSKSSSAPAHFGQRRKNGSWFTCHFYELYLAIFQKFCFARMIESTNSCRHC